MANDFRKSQTVAKAAADAEAVLFNSGYLYIYDSTMVDGTSAALTTQAQIVRIPFGATAFTTAALGFPVTLTSTGGTANSTFSSTATWFRCTGNTTTANLCQGTIGTTATTTFDILLNAVVISSGAAVNVSSFVINVPTS
jgi:hypothetical protein